MSTITKQWLQQKISDMEAARDEIPFGLDEDDSNTLDAMKLALASLEAEAVAWVIEGGKGDTPCHLSSRKEYAEAYPDRKVTPLYTAPPAPSNAEPVAWLWSHRKHPSEVTLVRPEDDEKAEAAMWSGWSCQALYAEPPAPVSMPDEITFEKIAEITASQGYEYSINECICAASWWNACRAAMLQGAEPVTTAYKLRDAVEIIRNSGIEIDAEKILAERDALNVPDCWCRTCRPVTISDMRFVVCPECGNKRCPCANDHRNACTGSNEPGQVGSAYPAAPQQES